MNFKPIFDRVIAKEIVEKKQTKSGITLETNNEQNGVKKAKVVAVGNGTYEDGFFISMQVNIGDTILYEEHTAIPFKNGNENLILLKQTDILAKNI